MVVIGYTEVDHHVVELFATRRLELGKTLEQGGNGVISGKPHLIRTFTGLFLRCTVKVKVTLKRSFSKKVCQLVVHTLNLLDFSTSNFVNMNYCAINWGHLKRASVCVCESEIERDLN